MASRRLGRKRKEGSRYPSGDLVRDALEDRAGPAQVKRMRDYLLRSARDPALGTPMGRMFLDGFLDAAEYNAGIKFAFMRAKADRAMGIPARNPKALDYNHGLGGRSLVVDDPDYETAIVDAFDAVEAAIGLHSRELLAVQHVAIYDDEPDGYEQKLAFKAGLVRAVAHWRLA